MNKVEDNEYIPTEVLIEQLFKIVDVIKVGIDDDIDMLFPKGEEYKFKTRLVLLEVAARLKSRIGSW